MYYIILPYLTETTYLLLLNLSWQIAFVKRFYIRSSFIQSRNVKNHSKLPDHDDVFFSFSSALLLLERTACCQFTTGASYELRPLLEIVYVDKFL